jgi:hypothetical protein
MALRQSTKTYLDACDVPTCMCADAEVVFFLKDDLLTLSGKAYVDGTVVSVTELSTGAVQVVIQYDDADLPDVDGEKLEVIFPGVVAEGTVCDPDCAGECSWVKKVFSVLSSIGQGGIINRPYLIYPFSENVIDGQFELPRIPFPTGYRLTSVRLTCRTYDINTTTTVELRIGSTVYAQFIGDLREQRAMNILIPVLPYDQMPELHLNGTVSSIYLLAAKGLVLEMIGGIES